MGHRGDPAVAGSALLRAIPRKWSTMIKKLDECVFDALLEADVEDEVVDLVLAALG